MNLYTMNLIKLGESTDTKKRDPSIANPLVFIEQALVIFAHVPLKRNEAGLISMQDTMISMPEIVTTLNGTVNRKGVMGLVTYLCETNRSALVSNMAKNPLYGSLTPLFMFAHKRYNDIKYEEWDKKDSSIRYALGKFLAEAVTDLPNKPITLSADEVRNLRDSALTFYSGVRIGTKAPATNNKMSRSISTSSGEIFNKNAAYILLQTWLANADIRKPDAMILDLWDWDNTPEALDTVPELPEPVKTHPATSRQLPWD